MTATLNDLLELADPRFERLERLSAVHKALFDLPLSVTRKSHAGPVTRCAVLASYSFGRIVVGYNDEFQP